MHRFPIELIGAGESSLALRDVVLERVGHIRAFYDRAVAAHRVLPALAHTRHRHHAAGDVSGQVQNGARR